MAKADYDKEFLYSFYFKHGGNFSRMTKDRQCPIKSRTTLSRYAKEEGWLNRYEQEMAQMNTELRVNDSEKLSEMRMALIQKAVKIAESQPDDVANIYSIVKVWEMLRTEMGQPIRYNAPVQQPQDEQRTIRSVEEIDADIEHLLSVMEFEEQPQEVK